jgi:hypothetical protein
MTCICDFVTDLARTCKSYLEIKEIGESVYGEKARKKTTIYAIIHMVQDAKTPMISVT